MTRIILSGGGTAGHIYPALALADELRQRGVELNYVGTPQGPESRLIPRADIDFHPLPAAGFNRARPWTLASSGITVLRSAARACELFNTLRPDAVVGFGGYVAIPVGIAAGWLHVPLALHEQNSVLGMTNRFLAKRADLVALTYENTRPAAEKLAKGSVEVIGNPVRGEVVATDRSAARAHFGLEESQRVLLVFGGSRGARHINEAIVRLAPQLAQVEGLAILHATGPDEYDATLAELDRLAPSSLRQNWQLFPYLDDMPQALAAADIALTRAGATTLAELTAAGLPSVLVPYPFATDDHQSTNAAALADDGAAALVSDKDLDGDKLVSVLLPLLQDDKARATMASKAHAHACPQAAGHLADSILSLISP